MSKNYSLNFKEIQQALELIPEDKFPDIRKIKYALTFDGLNLSKPHKNESGIYSTEFWRNTDEEKMISIALTLLFVSARNLGSSKPTNLSKSSRIRIPNEDITEFPITRKIHDFLSIIEDKESLTLINKLRKKQDNKKEMGYVSFIFVKCPAENFHIDHGHKRTGVISVNGNGTMVLDDKNSKNVLRSCINSHDRKHADNETGAYSYSYYDYFAEDINKRIKQKSNHNDLFEKSKEVNKGNLAVWKGIETPNPKVHSSPKCKFTETPSEDGNILPSFISFLKNNPSIISQNTVLLSLSKLKPEFISQIESSRKLVSVLQTNILDTHLVANTI
jgi:hypothetical protein